MKKLFLALLVVLFATTAVAQTMLGESCDNPIPVDENYEATIDGPCTLWYSATTYDLPLNVHFIPTNATADKGPKVEIDFTCEPGKYSDPKLDSLVNLVDEYVDVPILLYCDYIDNKETGRVEWDLSVNSSYRENLAEFGIPYNVKAFIKVTYYESGRVTLKPDDLFKNCMENAEYLHLGDTIDIVANDAERVFVLPYVDWQEDSIRFVWIGEQSATIYAAVQECGFEPISSNDFVKMTYVVLSESPKKLYSDEMKSAIKDYKFGGLYYGKVMSTVPGKLVVEKIPMAAAQGGATLLEYGKSIQLEANDTNTLFCFPRNWKATQFVSTSGKPITIYVSNSTDFSTQTMDANVLAYYDFSSIGEQRELSLSSREMQVITDQVVDDYVYVRFSSKVATTITAYEWSASECADKSTMIVSGKKMTIAAKSANNILRLRYDDWRGYDITLDWRSNGASLPVYIADTCAFTLSFTNARVVCYKQVAKKSILTIPADDVDSWADRVDSDGFLYVRLNPGKQSTLYVTSARPEEPESPCVANSIELKSGDQVVLNLDSAFTIYRINYAEWVAKDNKLVWSGSEPLHTFVAETCQFAVAPYNKYVVNYVVVPAAGEYVLDVTTLTQYADKVDADGYLYIRFLTEKEGSLSVTSY